MKKLMLLLLVASACKSENHDGEYVNHSRSPYSITDDTLEVRDTIIIEHSSFQRIHQGHLLPKEFKTKRLFELQPQFKNDQLLLNQIIYEKI